MTGITLFTGDALLSITGGKYAAVPGTDGLFVSGFTGTSGAPINIGKLSGTNDIPTFEGAKGAANDKVYLFVYKGASAVVAAKCTINDAVFKSNTDVPAFKFTKAAALFKSCTFESNTASVA